MLTEAEIRETQRDLEQTVEEWGSWNEPLNVKIRPRQLRELLEESLASRRKLVEYRSALLRAYEMLGRIWDGNTGPSTLADVFATMDPHRPGLPGSKGGSGREGGGGGVMSKEEESEKKLVEYRKALLRAYATLGEVLDKVSLGTDMAAKVYQTIEYIDQVYPISEPTTHGESTAS